MRKTIPKNVRPQMARSQMARSVPKWLVHFYYHCIQFEHQKTVGP